MTSPHSFERIQMLLGSDFDKLKKAKVAIFGLGGVGGSACEALGRSGIGRLILIDFDTVNTTNLNRLTIADGRDIGKQKTIAARDRILSVNPEADIKIINDFLDEDSFQNFIKSEKTDYCIDAIDSLGPKISIIENLLRNKIKFISSTGAAGRLNPSLVRFGHLTDVKTCGLATRIRSILRKNKFFPEKVKVVYSDEYPEKPTPVKELQRGRSRGIQSSCMMVPVTFGMYLAYHVISKIIEKD